MLKRNLDEVVYETICEGFVGSTYLAGKRLDPAELSERDFGDHLWGEIHRSGSIPEADTGCVPGQACD